MSYPSEETYLKAANILLRRYHGGRNSYVDQLDQLLVNAKALSNLISFAASSGDAVVLEDVSIAAQQLDDQLTAARVMVAAWDKEGREGGDGDMGSMENVVPFRER